MTSSSVRADPPVIAAGDDARVRCPARRWRRPLFFLLVTATAALGVLMMLDILRANGITVLEGVILPLFAVTFTWITIASWSAVIGFALRLARRDPLSLERVVADDGDTAPPRSRTAVVMPVYNEDPGRVAAGLEAVIRDLRATGQAEHFAFFLLSDTTDEATAEAERAAWAELARRLGPEVALFYRRRADNRGRKAGNIADFCRRWGGYYEHMIVLDADSLMSGAAMLALVRGMEANPDAGLIQTVPIPVRQRTFFGRFLQFAATLHSPVLATGFSFWQTDAANYWGHNAIIRLSAFTESCGLPELPGRPPLGGEILSHDFVEAALLRRRGWRCYLFPDLTGSYEEVPGNLLEFAKRDRRWTQGNLQHLKVLAAGGLHPVSRLHMVMGVLAFASSLLWLLMLAASTVDAVWRAVGPPSFFTDPYQLFPDWPIARPGMITSLLALTITVLVLPKVLALVLGLVQQRAAFGGAVALVCGAATELAFSVLIAPLMMTFHALFVTGVLLGRQVSWRPQTREGRAVPWREAVGRTAVGTAAALLWGGIAWVYAPLFFWWLSPVLVGLVLAAPIVRLSSSPTLGALAARARVFVTPAETQPPAVLACADRLLGEPAAVPSLAWNADRELPAERSRVMAPQSLAAPGRLRTCQRIACGRDVRRQSG